MLHKIFKKNMFLACFAVLSALSFPLTGSEKEKDQRVEVGARALSHKETLALKEERSQEGQDRQSNDVELKGKGKSLSLFSRYLHPNTVHWVNALTPKGGMIEIEDGSMWKVSPHDSYKVQGWLPGDELYITQNTSWFSIYDYRLHNRMTGSSVETNLSLGPLLNNPYTHWITDINLSQNLVLLEDGSSWEVYSGDALLLKKWLATDVVVVGVNQGWCSSTRPCLLINVNMNQYVRALDL